MSFYVYTADSLFSIGIFRTVLHPPWLLFLAAYKLSDIKMTENDKEEPLYCITAVMLLLFLRYIFNDHPIFTESEQKADCRKAQFDKLKPKIEQNFLQVRSWVNKQGVSNPLCYTFSGSRKTIKPNLDTYTGQNQVQRGIYLKTSISAIKRVLRSI